MTVVNPNMYLIKILINNERLQDLKVYTFIYIFYRLFNKQIKLNYFDVRCDVTYIDNVNHEYFIKLYCFLIRFLFGAHAPVYDFKLCVHRINGQ